MTSYTSRALSFALALLAAAVAGLVAWGLSVAVAWPPHLVGRLIQSAICGAAGLVVYGVLASGVGVPEARQLSDDLRRRLVAVLPGS